MEYCLAGLPGFPCSCFESFGNHFKIDLRGFLVAVNSTNFQSDYFPSVNVQCLLADAAKLQEFYHSET